MTALDRAATTAVVLDILAERERQEAKWGPQSWPFGTGGDFFVKMAKYARQECDEESTMGRTTWQLILTEEFFEAMAETDPVSLREELIQVAAVAVQIVEDIDRKTA